MKHIKKFEKETDEYWNKIVSGKIDKNSEEYKKLIAKQFEIDDKYERFKYKYLIAKVYYPYYNDTRIELIKCISTMLNHMHAEAYSRNKYGDIEGKYYTYDKSSIEIKLQNIDIINSFNTFKEAEEFFVNIEKYNI
jgi:hypothetical protein